MTGVKPHKASKRPNEPSTLIKSYLVLYNQASLIGWSGILFLTISEIYKHHGDYKTVSSTVWPLLKYVQTAAILETIHSLVGWVSAPVSSTITQLGSRMFLTWCVGYMVPKAQEHISFVTMIATFAIAEIIRFSYYLFALIKTNENIPKSISWARYNCFIVLFPMGISSEMTFVYQAIQYAKEIHYYYYVGLITATVFYIPGFPFLYHRMFIQRKKYINGEKKKNQ